MWPNPQFPTDLVAFTKEIINGKFHFLCIVIFQSEKNLPSENLSRGNVPFSIYIPGHTDQKKLLKIVLIRSFSGPSFPAFGLNAKIYGVNLRIESEYRKIRTRQNSVFGHFSRSNCLGSDTLKFNILAPKLHHFLNENVYCSLPKNPFLIMWWWNIWALNE